MNALHFDRLARLLSQAPSRRRLLGGLAALAAAGLPGAVDARKKHKKRKNKKVKFNEFGCVNVGNYCKNSGQCCSGICEGRKGKRKCQAHDQSTCLAGQTTAGCGGVDVPCTSTTGDETGQCGTTTGNAAYCGVSGTCFTCAKDADCVEVCGPLAACVVCVTACAEVTGGTACWGPSLHSCTLP